MIKITYIFHSGFVLETDRCVLVFDYWMDPSDVLHQRVDSLSGKNVYVFASHFHEDHFTRDIFSWKNGKVSADYTYILSKDIMKRRRARKEEADVWMAKGGEWEDENIKVFATGSNDSGVSWIVEVDGKRIFHAGDLCNWYARFLTEMKEKEDNEGECFEDDNREEGNQENGNNKSVNIINDAHEKINPIAEEKHFLGELKDIRKIADSFDIVMFPVDGRIGNGYTLGARQFIDRFEVGLFIPMHFVMSGFESAWRMEPFCQEKEITFWRIDKEGASICYEKGTCQENSLCKEK